MGAGNNLRVRLEARVDMQEDEDMAEDEVSIIRFMQLVSIHNNISNKFSPSTSNPNPVVIKIL